jgi:transcriptional regulator with XRE-family HTH domain
MTTSPDPGHIPEWTRGDRLRKARLLTGMTTRDFATHVGVSQKTITDAENDKRATVRKILLNAWSLATGVPVEWLENGADPTSSPTPGPANPLPRLDSNQQPSVIPFPLVRAA